MAAVLAWIGQALLALLLLLLSLLLLLLFTPLRICISYIDEWKIRLFLFGWIPVFRYSPEKNEQPQEQQSADNTSAPAPKESKKQKPSLKDELKSLYRADGVGGVTDFLKGLLSLATTTLSRVCRFLTVRKLELCIRVGAEEADQTAVRYGGICAALFPTLSALAGLVRFRKKRIVVQPDFLATSTQARMRMIVWVWPFGIVWAGICFLLRFLLMKAEPSGATSSGNATPLG